MHAATAGTGATDETASDLELLAGLISADAARSKSVALAQAVLDAAGGLQGLRNVAASQLVGMGVGREAAERVRLALALGARAASAQAESGALDAEGIFALLRPLIASLRHEEMHVVYLDPRGRFAGRRRVAKGGASSCSLYVRDVLAPVLEARVPAFVLAHNHPSGLSAPSAADVSLTLRVAAAADVVGARLVDHLVITDDAFASALPGGGRWSAERGTS